MHVLNIFGFHLVHPPPISRLTSVLHPGNIGRKIINCHNCTHKYTPNRLFPAVGRARHAVMTNFLWLPRSACVASSVLIIHANTLTHTHTRIPVAPIWSSKCYCLTYGRHCDENTLSPLCPLIQLLFSLPHHDRVFFSPQVWFEIPKLLI